MNKICNLNIFVVAFSVLMIGTSAASNIGFISPALASTDESNTDESSTNQTDNEQPTLETVDTHLEECIQQLENDNTNEALDECQSADDELDRILVNSTG
jgi:hypothetical protein